MSALPEGVRINASIDSRQEFVVNVMPQSDGKGFHPSFLVIYEDRDNFSAESAEELIRYYRKVRSQDSLGILVKSNHHLVLWDAKDRKAERGTVLQERHFSPEWKTFRDEERVFIDRLIRIATKARIQVWVNEGMDWMSGKWRLMTPPFDLDVRGDAKVIERSLVEIRDELSKVFSEARKAGRIPGIDPNSHGEAHGNADFGMRDGWTRLDRYPLKVEIKAQVEGSEDLLEYRYEKTKPESSWKLREAWRVKADGKRTRLALPRSN